MKKCKHCNGEVKNPRKAYCSDHCKWHYNMLKRDREKHLPPVRKRNKNYFLAAIGAGHNSLRGHGGRSRKGAMAARVVILHEEIQEVTKENLEKHFEGLPNWNYYPTRIKLGDGTLIHMDDIEKELGIVL